MAYEVGTKEVKPRATLGIRVNTTPADLGGVVSEFLPEVWGFLQERGGHPAGPPFARYHAYREDRIDVQAGLPVNKFVAGEGRIAAGELPGGEVAATWHVGPYDTLGAAYRSIEDWIEGHNRKPAGAPWEVYWTDPGETPDPAGWKTEVLWPIGQPSRSENGEERA